MSQNFTYGINLLGDPHRYPVTEQIKMLHRVGFGSFFTHWDPLKTAECAEAGAKHGLSYDSIHAPCRQTPLLWLEGDEGDAVLATLKNCVTDCARNGVPVMVIHPSIGYDVPSRMQIGVDRYARLLELAERLGVTVGFENLESEECLAAVMNAHWQSPACGFCFDAGHEQCHNHGRDMMALYGEKLCLTHLNDNHGRWAPETEPDFRIWNDMHLPPGDGIVDWKWVMERIQKSPYRGPLMCELKLTPSPGRTDHDAYRAMPLEDFYALALQRIRAVAENHSS